MPLKMTAFLGASSTKCSFHCARERRGGKSPGRYPVIKLSCCSGAGGGGFSENVAANQIQGCRSASCGDAGVWISGGGRRGSRGDAAASCSPAAVLKPGGPSRSRAGAEEWLRLSPGGGGCPPSPSLSPAAARRSRGGRSLSAPRPAGRPRDPPSRGRWGTSSVGPVPAGPNLWAAGSGRGWL